MQANVALCRSPFAWALAREESLIAAITIRVDKPKMGKKEVQVRWSQRLLRNEKIPYLNLIRSVTQPDNQLRDLNCVLLMFISRFSSLLIRRPPPPPGPFMSSPLARAFRHIKVVKINKILMFDDRHCIRFGYTHFPKEKS